MGLNCPKCGTDNLLNAIFCRGCGEKLDLTQMKPDNFVETKKKKGTPRSVQIVTAVICGLIILVAIGLVCPVGGKCVAEESLGDQAKADWKAVKKKDTPSGSFTFSDQDATTQMKKSLKLKFDEEGGDVVVTNACVRFKEGNVIQVIQSTKLFGVLPMDNVLNYTVTCDGKGTAECTVSGARIGYIPLMFGLESIVVDKIEPMVGDCKDYGKLQKNAKAITTADGSITFEI